MKDSEIEHHVTRRDFLARSCRVAGAAPAVTLLLSTTTIPSRAVASYTHQHTDYKPQGGNNLPGGGTGGGSWQGWKGWNGWSD
jgi:hypothetical protein